MDFVASIPSIEVNYFLESGTKTGQYKNSVKILPCLEAVTRRNFFCSDSEGIHILHPYLENTMSPKHRHTEFNIYLGCCYRTLEDVFSLPHFHILSLNGALR